MKEQELRMSSNPYRLGTIHFFEEVEADKRTRRDYKEYKNLEPNDFVRIHERDLEELHRQIKFWENEAIQYQKLYRECLKANVERQRSNAAAKVAG